MKKLWHIIAICSTLLIYISSCTPSAKDDGLGHNHDHGSHGGGNHEGEIVLSTEQAQKFGVYSQMVKPRDFNKIIKVSGQIESAPTEQSIVAATAPGIVKYTPGIVEGKIVSKGAIIARISSKSIAGGDRNESARIAVDATKRELDRLTPLHEDGIVSTKEYNAAKQAYEEACAAYSGTPTGGAA